MPDIAEMVDFFEERPEYDPSVYAHKKMKTTPQSSLEVLQELVPLLEEQEDYSNDALYRLLLSYVEKKGCKNGYVLWPVRIAVSGKQMTPAGATEIMEILGKEESLKRIRKGICLLYTSIPISFSVHARTLFIDDENVFRRQYAQNPGALSVMPSPAFLFGLFFAGKRDV